jgi:hypothetical protein
MGTITLYFKAAPKRYRVSAIIRAQANTLRYTKSGKSSFSCSTGILSLESRGGKEGDRRLKFLLSTAPGSRI